MWLTLQACTPHQLPLKPVEMNQSINQSILQLRTQIEYQSKLNIRFAGRYGFTAFLVDISTLNEMTNQFIAHERLRMFEEDIGHLSTNRN